MLTRLHPLVHGLLDEASTGLTPASLPLNSFGFVGTHPRAHARATRVLEEAFSRDETALVATLGLREGEREETFTKASLLEGGAQKSHDPSRTAEGAVKSYYEQQIQHERAKKVVAKAAAEDAARRAERTRLGGPDEERFVWSQGEGSSGQARWRTSELACRGHRDELGAPASVPPRSPNPSIGTSTLRDALTPFRHNARWTELFAQREDAATSSDDEFDMSKPIDLVSVLSRDDALELSSMLVSAIKPASERTETALAYSAQAVLVEIKFPETSVFRHAAGFAASAAEPASPHAGVATCSMEASSVGSGSVSDGAKSIAHEAQGQGPAVRSKHKGIQGVSDSPLPLLQIIATFMPDDDAVVCTTVVTNVPLSVSVSGTVRKPSAEFERERALVRERMREAEAREAVSLRRHVEETQVPSAVAQQERGEDVLAETIGRRSRHKARDNPNVREMPESLPHAEVAPSPKQGLEGPLRHPEPPGRKPANPVRSGAPSSRPSDQVFSLRDAPPERASTAPTIARLFSTEGAQLNFLREDEIAASKRRLGQPTPARVTPGKGRTLAPGATWRR